jgi:hypothetical protein
MYKIDLNTCTPRDVIERSITCHPSTLADRLNDAAAIHYWAAEELGYDKSATQAARLAGDNAKNAANCVTKTNTALVGTAREAYDAMSFGERLAAYGAAHKLQCISRDLALRIIERNPQSFYK